MKHFILSVVLTFLSVSIHAEEKSSTSSESAAGEHASVSSVQASSGQPATPHSAQDDANVLSGDKEDKSGEATPHQQTEAERIVTALRDPFRRPITKRVVTQLTFVPKTEVERYPVDSFKLTGVVTGLNEQLAMVVAPNGRTYHVREKMRIGNRGGVVQRITDGAVIVRERIINARGVEENIVSEIKMPDRVPAGTLEDDANSGLMEK